MAVYKKANINGSWQFVKLSDEEEEQVVWKHRQDIKKLAREAVLDASSVISDVGFGDNKNLTPNLIRAIAPVILERRADHIYTALQNEIDRQLAQME